jgi:5'-nucleotidase
VRRWPLLTLLLAGACARPVPAPAPTPTAATGPRTITLVTTTDIHGRLESLPWISGYVQNLRAARRAEGGDVLLVDAGDMWQGTLESNLGEGAASVRAYNALGYHAVTIGNHEFDFGPVGPDTVPRKPSDNPTGNIEARARQARFPFLAANLLTREGAAWTPPNIRPSTMVTLAGVRIGLIGITTTATPSATDPRNLVRLTVTPLRDVVVREATRLREAGAAAVVLLAHAGGRCESFGNPDDLSSCRDQGEIFRLARDLPAGLVDAIAAGHAHDGIAHRVNGIAIVEPFNVGRAFGRIDLVVDPAAARVTSTRIHPPQYVCDGKTGREIDAWAPDTCTPPDYEGRPVRHDASLLEVLRGDIERARRKREQPLGVVAPRAYPHSTRDESPASHLVVDLLHAAHPDADVAIYNATGTRTSLPAGPITYGRLYALLPFDSVIATATLPTSIVADAILRGVSRGPIPIVSGIEVDITCEGARPRVAVSRQGQVLAPDAPLKVVTSEFLSSGGGGYFPDMADRFRLQLDTPMRESIVAVIGSQAQGITGGAVGHHDPERRRVRVPNGTLPVRCQ